MTVGRGCSDATVCGLRALRSCGLSISRTTLSLGRGYRGTLTGPLSLEVACGMDVWMPVPPIRCWLPATGGGPDPRCVRDAAEVLGALYIAENRSKAVGKRFCLGWNFDKKTASHYNCSWNDIECASKMARPKGTWWVLHYPRTVGRSL